MDMITKEHKRGKDIELEIRRTGIQITTILFSPDIIENSLSPERLT